MKFVNIGKMKKPVADADFNVIFEEKLELNFPPYFSKQLSQKEGLS